MKQGFTLLELSIVLVIIGLIIGGITVGADMIRSAELNSVISDVNNYKTAINIYKLKYNALPGDHKNATAYWGIAAGDGYNATCTVFESTGTETCDGNGDGRIWGAGFPRSEVHRAWQHLASSEIISGTYTGAQGVGGYADHTAGKNQPEGKISSSAYTLWNYEQNWYFAHNINRLIISVGSDARSGQNYSLYPLFTAAEAASIDTKSDDGNAGSGKISPHMSIYAPNCTTTAIAATAEYELDEDVVQCSLGFIID